MSHRKDSACSAAIKGGCCLVPLHQMLAVKCQITLCDKHLPILATKGNSAVRQLRCARPAPHAHTHLMLYECTSWEKAYNESCGHCLSAA